MLVNTRIGETWGRYRLTQLLGTGAVGEVYLGEHVLIPDALAAIKILQPGVTTTLSFIDEARVMMLLSRMHYGIVPIFEFDEQNKAFFLVMQYAPLSLRQKFPPGTIVPPQAVVQLLKAVTEALNIAHTTSLLQGRGIVHRDLKPENILIQGLAPFEWAALTDFGVFIPALSLQTMLLQAQQGSPKQTAQGTPDYAAPEQWRGMATPESDQYGLACVVYELLTGQKVFEEKVSLIDLRGAHLNETPKPLRTRNPLVPVGVEQVVLQALEKDPAKRFKNILAFWQALESAVQQASRPQAPPMPVAVGSSPTNIPVPVRAVSRLPQWQKTVTATLLAGTQTPLPILATGDKPDQEAIIAYATQLGVQAFSYDDQQSYGYTSPQKYKWLEFFYGNSSILALREDSVIDILNFPYRQNQMQLKFAESIAVKDISCVTVSSSSGLIAVGHEFASVTIYELAHGVTPTQKMDYSSLGQTTALKFIPGTKQLVICFASGEIQIWQDIQKNRHFQNNASLKNITKHPPIPPVPPAKRYTPVPYTILDTNDKYIVVSAGKKEIHILTMAGIKKVLQTSENVVDLALDPSGKTIAITTANFLLFADILGSLLATHDLTIMGLGTDTHIRWLDKQTLVAIDSTKVMTIAIS